MTSFLTDLAGNPRVCIECGKPLTYESFAGFDKAESWCWDCVHALDEKALAGEKEPRHE